MGTSLRVDAHQHFWRYDPVEYGWIDDSMTALRRDFQPPDLAPLLQAATLDGSLAVQARSTEQETRDLLTHTHDHSARVLGVIGWLDLAAPDIEAQLDRFAGDPRLVGLRHVVQDEPDDRFLDREPFRHGVRAAAARGLVYDLLVYPRQLPAALDFARALDGVPIVLDHCAKPPLRAGHGTPAMAAWERDLRALGALEHVVCKVSGLVTEADWARWRPEDLLRCIDVALDAFGPQRVLFGSDWPVSLLAAPYTDVLALAERAVTGCTKAEQAAFFGGNATRVYGLDRRAT